MIISELLEKGGIVMIAILLLSVYVLAVILYKIFQFWQYRKLNKNFSNNFLKVLEQDDFYAAMDMAAEKNHAIARIAKITLKVILNDFLDDDKKIRQIETSGSKEIRTFESHLRGLEMSAAIAPLLGLLGTVIGMIRAFSSIGKGGGNVDPAILANGIWEALIATVAGLAVAIPALAAYYIIDGQIEHIRATMKDLVSTIFAKYEEIIIDEDVEK